MTNYTKALSEYCAKRLLAIPMPIMPKLTKIGDNMSEQYISKIKTQREWSDFTNEELTEIMESVHEELEMGWLQTGDVKLIFHIQAEVLKRIWLSGA